MYFAKLRSGTLLKSKILRRNALRANVREGLLLKRENVAPANDRPSTAHSGSTATRSAASALRVVLLHSHLFSTARFFNTMTFITRGMVTGGVTLAAVAAA